MKLILLASLLLSGCATVRATAWRHDPDACLEEHNNGLWVRDRCRDGTGVLAWAVWVM